MEEKLAMRSQCEETVATKAEEAEQAKLELIKTQQDLILSEEKVCLKPAHFICSIICQRSQTEVQS